MKPGTTEYVELQDFLAAHKGAGLAALVGLFVLGRPAGIEELAGFCDYSRPSVRAGLVKLEERGFVAHFQYRGGWELTARARQLPLFGALAPAELEKVFLLAGGSSSDVGLSLSLRNPSGENPNTLIPTTTPTTTGPLEKVFPFAARHIVQALLSMGGVGQKKAEAAVLAALERGETADALAAKVAACAAYTLDPKSRGLRFPGAWAAGLVERGYNPPDPDLIPNHEVDESDPHRWDGWVTLINEQKEGTDEL